jgi:hypothetical protein
MVFGLRLPGGTDLVVKAREDDGRAETCVAVQALLAERGFPCPRPLTPVIGVGSLAVHAEELRPGGEVLQGDSPDVAARYAEVFARLMAELADVTVAPPLPNPPWVRWDHTGSGVWPALAGAASGSFASAGPPVLAPIASSEAFLEAYQGHRGRLFTAVEQEVAWAASVWMAAYNLWESLHGDTPLSGEALRAQAAERLRRANA